LRFRQQKTPPEFPLIAELGGVRMDLLR